MPNKLVCTYKLFQPGLTFVSNARTYPSEAHFKYFRFRPYPQILHQVRETGVNGLAYLDYFLVMKKKKSFMTLTPALSGCPEVF
jgi:hypothetical protein